MRSVNRRQVLGTLGTVAASAFSAKAREPSEESRVTWGSPDLLTPQLLLSKDAQGQPSFQTISAGHDVAIIFTSMRLNFDRPQAANLYASKIAAFHIPISIPDLRGLTGFVQELTIGAITSPGARAMVFADIGGVGLVKEYPIGKPANGEIEVLSLPRRVRQDQKEPLEICSVNGTICILTERLTPDDIAIVDVDSLDITAAFGPLEGYTSKLRAKRPRKTLKRS